MLVILEYSCIFLKPPSDAGFHENIMYVSFLLIANIKISISIFNIRYYFNLE